jgi:gluconolactonase
MAAVERIATGCRWSEGPVWFGDGRYLLWSDIPNNRMLRWDEETGTVSAYRKPSNYANGNTRDRQGRLITCEHGGRRVIRTEYDGSITVLIDSFDGKRLNSPNDVVVKSDGSIWFTDPIFGILGYYEGDKAEPEIPANVYRLDPDTGKASVVAEGVLGPNGLCFSPDESILYIVESRGVPNRKILAYDVTDGGRKIANKRVLIDAGPGGTPDGMRCDIDGNLWCGWGMGSAELDGVMIFAPDGKPIGRIALPERCANVCFGGRKRNRLFMAASQSVYALYVNTQGALGG